jgi:hypothetical protein
LASPSLIASSVIDTELDKRVMGSDISIRTGRGWLSIRFQLKYRC